MTSLLSLVDLDENLDPCDYSTRGQNLVGHSPIVRGSMALSSEILAGFAGKRRGVANVTTNAEPDSSARLCQELRDFRIAGARGFARRKVSVLREIAAEIIHPHPAADETIDDVLVAAITFCLAAEVRGQARAALRVHLGLQQVPAEVARRLGLEPHAPELAKHKYRAAAAAILANYSKDHYAEVVLRPAMQRVAERLITSPPSLSDLRLAPQRQGDRSPFTVASHQFIPVWLGKARTRALADAYTARQCSIRGLVCRELALGYDRGHSLLFDFGVLVVHVREELHVRDNHVSCSMASHGIPQRYG